MEKNNKSYKPLIIFFMLIALCLAGYYVYDIFLSKDTNTNNIEDNLNTSSIENNTSNSDKKENNLLLEETFDYYINNSMHKITYKYYYNNCNKDKCLDSEENDSEEKYYITLKILFDDQKIDREFIISYGKLFENDYNKIKNMIIYKYNLVYGYRDKNFSYPFDRNNLNIIKGNDKEYLVINIPGVNEYTNEESVVIVNEKGIIIKEITFGGGQSVVVNQINDFYEIKDGEDSIYLESFKTYNQFFVDENNLYYFNLQCPDVFITKISIVDGKAVEKRVDFDKKYISVDGEDCY